MVAQSCFRTYSFSFIALCAAGLSALLTPASANDGGIAFGGSPGLLKGHASITMTREVIRIEVGKEQMKVDCRFIFTNHGPACTVRMGFPDQGVDAYDPDEAEDPAKVMHKPPQTTFESFQSYVEGKTVPVKLIRADKEGQYWHAKTVRFPEHSVLHIRDVYTQKTGGGIVSKPNRDCLAAQIGYILHTGASWHGNIGRSEVIITFRDPQMPAPVKAIPVTVLAKSKDGRDLRGEMPAANVVAWSGPCRPTVAGRTLRFVRANWRPGESDDIMLTYNYTEFHDPTDTAQNKPTAKAAGKQ